MLMHSGRPAVEYQRVEPRAFRDRGVEVQEHASWGQRGVNRAVEAGLGSEVTHVMQRQRSHHSIGGGERIQEAALAELDPVPEWDQTPPGLVEHRAIHIEDRDASL